MKIEECFQLGYIVKPHGIKGSLSILIDSDDPDYYKELESVYVDFQHKLIPFFIEELIISGSKATLKLRDIDTKDTALLYKGCALYLPMDLLPVLEDDQFYYHEIVGFVVKDRMYGVLGKVSAVYEANGNDLLAIDHKGREVLVPIQDEFIVDFDKESGTILVNLPDGLLDIYLAP